MSHLQLQSIQTIAQDGLKLSKANKLHDDHQAFLGERPWAALDDVRVRPKYQIGPEVVEAGLKERWDGYERDYRAEARISKFWHATLAEAVVEPENFVVVQGGRVVRETIKSKAVFEKLLPGVPETVINDAFHKNVAVEVGPRLEPKRRLDEKCCLLGFGLYNNYFNWTLRYASNIRAFQALAADRLLLVPSTNRKYIAESLEFLGVPQDRVHHVDEPVLAAELTVFCPNALGRYELSPHTVWNLRDHPQVHALWSRPAKKLYIPRRDVKLRRVVNEAELEASLKGLGFASFDCAAHPVREQAAAFKSADVIVAPHGAGLANIVYCKPGTRVFEIIPEGYDQGVTSYRSLSDLFGLNYEIVFAREVEVDRKGNRCNSHIAVNVRHLQGIIA